MNFEYVMGFLKDTKENLSKIKNLDGIEVYGKYISELQEAINLLESQSGGVLPSKSWGELTEEEQEISLRYIKAHAQFVVNGDNKTLSVMSAEDFIKEMSQ